MATISFKCDTCKRSVELVENPQGFTVVGKCVITNGCTGRLYRTERNPNNVRESAPSYVAGLDNYVPRRAFFEYAQTLASDKWTVKHNMGVLPSTFVYLEQDDGRKVLADNSTYTVKAVDKNTILVTFATKVRGIIQCVAKSTVPLVPSTVSPETAQTQVSANGIITFAVPKYLTQVHGQIPAVSPPAITPTITPSPTPTSTPIGLPLNLCAESATIQIEIEITKPNEDPFVCFENIENFTDNRSPWNGWGEVLVGKRRNYCVRTATILKLAVFGNADLESGDIPDGTRIRFLRIDYGTGRKEVIPSRGLLMLLAKSPYAYADKVKNRVVDVGELIGDTPDYFVYRGGELFLDENKVERSYPDISRVIYQAAPPQPSPTPTPTVTPTITATVSVTPSISVTPQPSPTPEATTTPTPTITPTVTGSFTPTPTPTLTPHDCSFDGSSLTGWTSDGVTMFSNPENPLEQVMRAAPSTYAYINCPQPFDISTEVSADVYLTDTNSVADLLIGCGSDGHGIMVRVDARNYITQTHPNYYCGFLQNYTWTTWNFGADPTNGYQYAYEPGVWKNVKVKVFSLTDAGIVLDMYIDDVFVVRSAPLQQFGNYVGINGDQQVGSVAYFRNFKVTRDFFITPTPTPTVTPTISVTPTVTPTISVTPTITPSVSITATITMTPTVTATPTITPEISITPTISTTPTLTTTPTPTLTTTPTISLSPTPTPTITPTATPGGTNIDGFVVAIMDENAANGATSMTDPIGKVYTFNGSCIVSDIRPELNGSALYIQNGSALINMGLFNLLSGDFTVEAYFILNSGGSPGSGYGIGLLGSDSNSFSGWQLRIVDSGLEWVYPGVAAVNMPQTWTTNTLYHVAISREGSDHYLSINGVTQPVSISLVTSTSSNNIKIGGQSYGGAPLNGMWIAHRVSAGISRYVADYTVPTPQFYS